MILCHDSPIESDSEDSDIDSDNEDIALEY